MKVTLDRKIIFHLYIKLWITIWLVDKPTDLVCEGDEGSDSDNGTETET